jgi:hypothetical protein
MTLLDATIRHDDEQRGLFYLQTYARKAVWDSAGLSSQWTPQRLPTEAGCHTSAGGTETLLPLGFRGRYCRSSVHWTLQIRTHLNIFTSQTLSAVWIEKRITCTYGRNNGMTTQLLATELANLIQESKRKHNDLRQVCVPLPLGFSKHRHRDRQSIVQMLIVGP